MQEEQQTCKASWSYQHRHPHQQLEKNATESGSVLREYELFYGFPTNVSQIDLAYDSNDQIEEFTVEFQYSYWKVNSGTTQNGVTGVKQGVGDSRLIQNW